MTRVSNRGVVPETVPVSKLSLSESMEAYDSLPAEICKLLQDAPFNCNIKVLKETTTIEDLKERMRKFQREVTLASYGPDHPSLVRPSKIA